MYKTTIDHKKMARFTADCTSFPRIFKESYWGTFKEHVTDGEGHDFPAASVVEARNRFVAEHGIVRYKNMPELRIKELDHQEFYVDKEKRIVHIYSQGRKYLYPGFRLNAPLYTPSQLTGLRKVETTASKNKLMKTLFSRFQDDVAELIQQYLKPKRRSKKARH
jgi:hypothetical protein